MAKLEEVLSWPTVRQMCQQADVCLNSGYAWVWKKQVEAIQVCGSWRVNPRDVERIRLERAERRAKREGRNGNS